MIKICIQKLETYLEKSICSCYFLFGNDYLLLQKGKNLITNWALKQNFFESINIEIDSNYNWNLIFNLCQTRSLFSNRQVLLLNLIDDNILSFKDKMLKLLKLIHDDLIIVLICNKKYNLSSKEKNFFLEFKQKIVLIDCNFSKKKIINWISFYTKKNKLKLSESVHKLLSNYYENNLSNLIQLLKLISLIYPNQEITTSKVKLILSNSIKFNYNQWIESTLIGETQKAINSIRCLRSELIEPIVLLQNIQYKLIQLLVIKRKEVSYITKLFFYNCKVCYNENELLLLASNRLNFLQIKNAIKLSIKIDSLLRKNCISLVWCSLETLTLILCGEIN